MSSDINIFLPMRAGSERIKRKNIRPFSDVSGGLCRIKLEQLLGCSSIGRIFVSTDDPAVGQIARSFNSQRIKVLNRPAYLASSEASTDDLIRHACEVMPDGHILWTHVTSPFLVTHIYEKIIKTFLENLNQFDSLMTVTKIQKFIWNDEQPINYDQSLEKWPRTQTLKPIWEVNSGAFLTSKEVYKRKFNRIGDSPFLFELDQANAFDIDWPSDFKIAEAMYKARLKVNRCRFDDFRFLTDERIPQYKSEYSKT